MLEAICFNYGVSQTPHITTICICNSNNFKCKPCRVLLMKINNFTIVTIFEKFMTYDNLFIERLFLLAGI